MNDKRQPGWRVGRDLTMTATSQEKPPNHISTNWFRWTITHREDIKLTMLEDEVVEHFSLSLFHSFTHSLSHTLSFFCLWMMTPPREGGRFRWRWMREEGRGGFSFIYSSITISNQFFASTFCVWNRDLNTSSPSLPILFLCLKRITVYSNLRIVVFRFPPSSFLSFFWGKGRREEGEEGRGGFCYWMVSLSLVLPPCFFPLKERIAWIGKFFLLFLKHFRVLTKEFVSYSFFGKYILMGLTVPRVNFPFSFHQHFSWCEHSLCWRRCNKASIPQIKDMISKQFICKHSFISFWHSFLSSHNIVVISYMDHVIGQKRGEEYIQVVQGKRVTGEWGSYTGTTFEEAPKSASR